MRSLILVPIAATLLSGCVSVSTTGSLSAPMKEKPDVVCIIRNPSDPVPKATGIFQKAFKDHGVDSVVCDSKKDCKSPWYMTYVLTRSWDVATFLKAGHLELYKGDDLVSYVDHNGGDGLNFAKFGRTQWKLESMIAALLGEKLPE